MKEIENNKHNIEISVKQKKQVEHELIGNIVPHEGHTVWKINKETLQIEKAKFSNVIYSNTIDNNGFQSIKKQLIVQDGYEYISALNKKNALKKYFKGKNGGKKLGNLKLEL